MNWDSLVKQRVKDAVKRSVVRGCGLENEDALFAEASALLRKQNFQCALCGVDLSAETGSSNIASLDRIFSSVKPSPTRKPMCGYLRNCRWVCWKCNHETRSCHMKFAKWKSELCNK